MDTVAERLRLARERAGYSSAKDAIDKLGLKGSTYYGHENGDRSPKPPALKEYARLFNVPYEWLADGRGTRTQTATVIQSPAPNASPPTPAKLTSPGGALLPVYGLAQGGPDGRFDFNGEVLDRVGRPPSLANVPNAYCVFVAGESMEPRYFAGEVVYVHPTKPVRKGCFVVVELYPENDGEPPRGYVKQFIAYAGEDVVLRQFNPDGEIRFRRSEVKSVHRIVMSGDDA